MNTSTEKLQKISLHFKGCEIAIKNMFDPFFALKKKRHAEHINFATKAADLDAEFDKLTSHVMIELKHGIFSHEERVEVAKALAHCEGFYVSQKKQLFGEYSDETATQENT